MLKMKKSRLALALAVLLVSAVGFSSSAIAGYTIVGSHIQSNSDGSHTVLTIIKNDETGKEGVHWTQIFADGSYDQGIVILADGDPQPDGSPSGLFDHEAAIEEAMKNGGAGIVKENHFLETTLGQTLIKHSDTGSIVPVHNPDPLANHGTGATSGPVGNPGTGVSNPVANGLNEDPLGDLPMEEEQHQGGLGGGGWYDPMGGSMYEQMIKAGKKKKKSSSSSSSSGDAASDSHDPGVMEYPADPELVNPTWGGLGDLSLAPPLTRDKAGKDGARSLFGKNLRTAKHFAASPVATGAPIRGTAGTIGKTNFRPGFTPTLPVNTAPTLR